MHPIFARTVRLITYVLAWLSMTAMLVFVQYYSRGITLTESISWMLPLMLIYAFICLSPWYMCRVLPIGRANMMRILGHHTGAAVVAASLWIILAEGLAILIARWKPGFDRRASGYLPSLFIGGITLYILAVALHYVFLSFQLSRAAELMAHEAKASAREAELRALKAQINPHFLFNSLNSISSLTVVDAKSARDMCIGLSEFLRSTLSLGEKESITFAEELGLVRTYLSVEQVRFGSRLKVDEHVDPSCGKCAIPPLLVQPLVENAIKHGIAGLLEGGTVLLEAICQDGRFHVRVENEFDFEAPAPRKSGLGLANVRNRLRTRYDDRARLETEIKGNSFRAELNLPCEEHKHA